jgi:hypothetical protein
LAPTSISAHRALNWICAAADWPARTGAGPRPWPGGTRQTSRPRRAKNTAIGSHAGPAGPGHHRQPRAPPPAPPPAPPGPSRSATRSPARTNTGTPPAHPPPAPAPNAATRSPDLSPPTAWTRADRPAVPSAPLRAPPDSTDSGGTAGSNPPATAPRCNSPATAPIHVLHPAHALSSWATSLIRAICGQACGQASSGNQIRQAQRKHRPQNRKLEPDLLVRGAPLRGAPLRVRPQDIGMGSLKT